MLRLKKYLYCAKSIVDPYPYRPYMNKHKVIFIHIPKTAGTTVLESLGAKKNRRDHLSHIVYRQSNHFKYEQYFKFAFVRNPLSRCISVYKYLSMGGNQGADKIKYKNVSKQSFDEFVDEYLVEPYLHSNHMLKPQYSFIYNEMGCCVVDFLGKQESFNKDFNIVLSKIGLSNNEIVSSNKSIFLNHVQMKSSTKDKIFDIYKKDYEYFGYS